MPASRRAFSTALVRLSAGGPSSASSSSSPSSSAAAAAKGPSPTSSASRRSRTAAAAAAAAEAAARSASDILPTLLVGPPDPISNLRPVRYVSPLDGRAAAGQQHGSSTGTRVGPQAGPPSHHPYSLSEFSPSRSNGRPHPSSSPPPIGTGAGATKGPAVPPSAYYRALLEKLEAASLAQRLRVSRAQAFDQRFWADNNLRFQRDQASALSAPSASSEGQAEAEGQGQAQAAANFYSAWLSANAARHRAYNRVLVRRTFADLAPEARWRALVAWVRVVGWYEREVRAKVLRRVLRLSSSPSSSSSSGGTSS
ncbi:hypothetical protein OC834_002032 [Tilletia horrida]|nr:hypothetical protein OC834_002032 [Tilletia horrida]